MPSACFALSPPKACLDWSGYSVMAPTPDSSHAQAESAEHAALVQRLQLGDRDALARLYDLLAKPLYSLALRITGDTTEAQDIVHDTFLQLWNKARSFDPARGSVFSWTATFVRNRAIDRIRTRRRRQELLAEHAGQAPATTSSDSADPLWLREKAAAVRAALASLAPDQKAALELAYFEGLTQQEIAERLNEPLGTIKARIRRGLLKLRDSLPARL